MTTSTGAALTFKPRPSSGRLWLAGVGLVVLLPTVIPTIMVAASTPSVLPVMLISAIVGLVIGAGALALAWWFPTMRYELDDQALTLRYGPVLTYRIPLADISAIRRRNLVMSLWSSTRLPGIALGGVMYGDVGEVRMCATASLNNIMLIEAGTVKYGVTPEDEAAFVNALKARVPAGAAAASEAG